MRSFLMEGTLLGATTLTSEFFTVMPYADNGDPHGHCPVPNDLSISGQRPHEGASIRKDLQSFYCVLDVDHTSRTKPCLSTLYLPRPETCRPCLSRIVE